MLCGSTFSAHERQARVVTCLSLASKLSQTSSISASNSAPISRRSITYNATTGTTQLGLTAPATISNTLARPSRTTQCRHTSALLHKHSRHQIHIRPQARPLCAPPRCARSQLHSDSSVRTESAFHTAAHRSLGSQAWHDCPLRPRDREAHTVHCPAGRPERSRCAQDKRCARILGRTNWCWAEGAQERHTAAVGALCAGWCEPEKAFGGV